MTTFKPRKREWIRLLPGLAVSLVALIVVISLIDPHQLLTIVRQADPWLFLSGVLIMAVWLIVRGFIWRTLLQNKASYRDVFFTLNEGYLINNILPFRLGEIARAFLLGRKAELGFWQVLSTIIIERAMDLAFAGGLMLSTLAFAVNLDWALEAAIGAILAVLTALFCLYLLARYRESTAQLVDKVGKRLPVIKKIAGTRLRSFLNGLAILTDSRLFLRALLWSTLDWAIGLGMYFVMLRAFFPQAKFLWAAFGLGAGALGIAAPSSPGAVGLFEAVLVGALAVFHLDPTTAAAYAFSLHALNYIMTGILGGYELAHERETFSSLYHQLRQVQQRRESS